MRPTWLALLLAVTPALAGDRPGDWTIDGAPDAPAGLRASLWLPMGPWPDGRQHLGDVLGHHAAAYPVDAPRAVVMLEGIVRRPEDVPVLDLARATLTPAGGEPLRPLEGDAWRGQPAGADVSPPLREGVLAIFRVPFPALDPACGDVTFSVPVMDRGPFVVRFRRWRDLVAEAERDLAAWKRHIAASAMHSAIAPYLDHPAFRRLEARGDPLLPAILLRELRAGEAGDADAVPRFLVLHVLARTGWGRQQGVPDHGDARAAARALARWRAVGHPSLPGLRPHERD
ncbi:MAG: hypothetical protein M9894_17955 [Planctomycetes bacterium]|nr:hypothetical protein [Planctomycetota bacterium]